MSFDREREFITFEDWFYGFRNVRCVERNSHPQIPEPKIHSHDKRRDIYFEVTKVAVLNDMIKYDKTSQRIITCEKSFIKALAPATQE